MGFTPPAEVRSNAKRGLELRQKYNRGGTAVGVARARDLSNGASLPLDTIKRMNSYFSRHEVDKKGEGWGKDSAGYIAWLLWGGDSGWAWVKGILRDEEKKEKAVMDNYANGYAEIIKQEKMEDGTLKVYGKATDDSIDIDQQICDPAWLAKAMPDWFTTGGNIREQHSNIAAGVATDYEVKGAEHFITALVVDPVSVKKVENNVLKGFSIGIRSPRVIRDDAAKNGRIVGGQIVEVSLVDRPANPNAKLMLAKAAESGELMPVEQTDMPNPKDVFGHLVKDAEVAEPVEEILEEIITSEPEVPELPITVEDDEDEEVEDSVPVEEATELINAAKGAVASLLKFDQATYDAATTALYDLIIVEANEGKQGSDERSSIKELLHSIKHLYHWYEGEAEEGEVAGVTVADLDAMPDMYLSANACECDCEDCKMDKGCDAKMCKCDSMKSVEGEETVTEESTEEKVEDEVKEISIDEEQVSEIVEKAKAAASEFVSAEIENLKKAIEAEKGKAIKLEEELQVALAKTATGGPKRSTLVASENQINEWLQKSAHYSTLAKSTNDPLLVKGYKELAEDAAEKARKVQKGSL